ncbi:MAG: ATP-binding protein [Chitinispirillaceae bacterium]|nr:ATP-binding protein [Chitinispirillaceae bacterium]
MKRYYKDLLFRYLRTFPCICIIGSRQCGKTTFLKELPETWKVYDLEKDADFRLIADDPDLFFRLNPAQIAIDEAQIFPALFKSLRVAIDADRGMKGRFVITGSSSPNLVRGISESLAGRVGIIELAPFSMGEAFACTASPLFDWLAVPSPSLNDLCNTLTPSLTIADAHAYWLNGGYPEPWLSRSEMFRRDWYNAFVQTYLYRDISNLFPRINKDRFRFFINLLMASSGSIINYSDLSRSLGITAPVVKDYFSIAHDTFIWRTIPPFTRKTLHRLVKHPKGYVRDSGILHCLQHITTLDMLLAHPKMGVSWEGMVMEELLRGLNCKGIACDYFFYRSSGGAEVDLVLEGDFGIVPIEIKHGTQFGIRQLTGIISFIEEFNCACGLVITANDKPQRFTEKLLGIPVHWIYGGKG